MSTTAISAAVKELISTVLDEYLYSNDAAEVDRQLAPHRMGAEVVKRAVYLLLDRRLSDSEKLASLVAQMTLRGTISYDEVQEGMRIMILRLPDLALDSPGHHLAGLLQFANWLVLSDVLDEDFLAPQHNVAILALVDAAGLHVEAVGSVVPPYVAEFHARLQAGLKDRLPSPLLDIRGMQREALVSYLSTGGMGIRPFIDAVAGPDASGLGQASRYARHELARSIWRAVTHASDYTARLHEAFALPTKRPGQCPAPDSVPSLPLAVPVVTDVCLQLLGELVDTGLLRPWDVEVGAVAVLAGHRPGLANEAEASALARAFASAVSYGALPLGLLEGSLPLPLPPFTNAWSRFLRGQRSHTGEWTVVREPHDQGPAPIAPGQVLTMARALLQAGQAPKAPAIPAARGAVTNAVVAPLLADLAAGGNGSAAAASVASVASSYAVAPEVVVAEAVRQAVVQAASGTAVPVDGLTAALVGMVSTGGVQPSTLLVGLGRALESVHALGGQAMAKGLKVLRHVVAGTVGQLQAEGRVLPQTKTPGLWPWTGPFVAGLPRPLLLAAKLDLEAGEGGVEHLEGGSAAALLAGLMGEAR